MANRLYPERFTLKTKSALSWFGSDAAVAPQLASYFNGCKHVAIPFAGGLSILPHLTARGIAANDLHANAINFFKTLKSRPNALIEMCRGILSHPEEVTWAIGILGDKKSTDLERAVAFWALCWVPRKGKGGTSDQMGSKPNASVRFSADGGNNASRLLAVCSDLAEWAEHFRRCEFTAMKFRKFIPKVHDKPENGIYADPPWLGAGDVYSHHFEESDHKELHRQLSRFKNTRIVVRYGDHEFIRDLYPGWDIVESSARTQANKQIDEIWIMRNMP